MDDNFFSQQSTTAYANGPPPNLSRETIESMLSSVEALEAMKGKDWLLASPDGRVWKDQNPHLILRVLAQETLKMCKPVFPINYPIVLAQYEFMENLRKEQDDGYDPCI